MNGHPARPARPGDYDAIAAVIDAWWGRPLLAALPRLFLDHFHDTSLVIDGPGGLVAFLIGILSPSEPERAYIHFVGVSPRLRGNGLARSLYERAGLRVASEEFYLPQIGPHFVMELWLEP